MSTGPRGLAVQPVSATRGGAAMTRRVAVANEKGGVAKTTTVACLGVALAELDRRVLLVDVDPEACLTFSLGLDPDRIDLSLHDVLLGRIPASLAVQKTPEGPDLLPATIELVGSEAKLLATAGGQFVLRSALQAVGFGYDWVLLDCPPGLGALTVAALTAADEMLIPLQCEALSYRGVGQLLDTIGDLHGRLAAEQAPPGGWPLRRLRSLAVGRIRDRSRGARIGHGNRRSLPTPPTRSTGQTQPRLDEHGPHDRGVHELWRPARNIRDSRNTS